MWTVFSDSTSANAYYYGFSNTIVVLAAILQPPIFNHYWPSYMKYGSTGFIIGNEIMHAFDTDMYIFDETGSIKQWYTDKSANEYINRTECYVQQYERYVDQQTGLTV
ncbi:neprilysin-2-like isoform X2 [Nasonia vitripennis]|uniref:Peptidase M13 C-terminal domain-containing protein n=1 Tax=Nasonia vitripennis TaxID=7425 RepID=A0A7M7R3L4_NASVI|nr:neprilysin-2-like isoform X2 [Nasonia vitripennis]